QTEEMQKTTEDSKTDAVDTKAAPVEMSQLNPKYPKMMNEFVYKDVLFVHWTTRRNIELVEQEFEFLPDDLLIATFPKSGTTLMQELAWLLRHNLDFAGAKASRVFERVPFLEENWTSQFPGHPEGCYPMQYLPEMPRPRIIKTHLPYHIIGPRIEAAPGPGFKTICVLRNPKDVLVSYYHFYKGVVDYGPWPWDFSSFFDMWMDGWIVAGDWFRVAKAWWAQRNRPDLLLVKFEDLVRRPALEIPRVADSWALKSQDDVKRFDAMKENPATNYSGVPGMLDSFSFMRSGKVGDWKRFFTVSQSEQFDRIYQAEMAGTGLDWSSMAPAGRLEIPRVAEFLGVEVGQDDVKRLANALSFDAMKENPATNYSGVPGMLDSFSFMRSGKVGDWKRFFTVSQSEQFDRIYQAEMAGTGLFRAGRVRVTSSTGSTELRSSARTLHLNELFVIFAGTAATAMSVRHV
uniref:Sulfotransfer_1 domain-containing protein n=1 Tax=Macrostomum lignano TaxID=282301 RepID=A0A1I8H2X7_9PLAT